MFAIYFADRNLCNCFIGDTHSQTVLWGAVNLALKNLLHRTGAFVREIAYLPLAEDIPIAFNSCRKGPRSLGWRDDRPAELTWIECQVSPALHHLHAVMCLRKGLASLVLQGDQLQQLPLLNKTDRPKGPRASSQSILVLHSIRRSGLRPGLACSPIKCQCCKDHNAWCRQLGIACKPCTHARWPLLYCKILLIFSAHFASVWVPLLKVSSEAPSVAEPSQVPALISQVDGSTIRSTCHDLALGLHVHRWSAQILVAECQA